MRPAWPRVPSCAPASCPAAASSCAAKPYPVESEDILKYLKRFLWLAFIVLLGIFAWRNQSYLGQEVNLVFFRQPVSLVLGFWLVVCFLLGLFIYMILDFPRDLRMKSELRRRQKEIARLQADVDRLLAHPPGTPVVPPPVRPGPVRPDPIRPDSEMRPGP